MFLVALLFVLIWFGRHYNKAIFYSGQSDKLTRHVRDLSRVNKDLHEECYRSLVEFSPEPMAVYCQGKIVYINPAGSKQLGTENQEELIDKTLWEIVHPDDYTAAASQVVKIIREQKGTEPTEWRFVRPDGKIIETEIRPLYATYHGIPAVQLFWRDITVQKKADRELQAAQQKLKDVLRFQPGVTFKFIKKGSAFIHTLCDGELCHQSESFHPDRIIGHTIEEFLSPDIARIAEPFYKQAWDSGEIVTYEMTCSGKTFFSTLRPMLLDGKVTEVIGLTADITANKQAEKELRQTKELLESIISSTTDAIQVIDKEGHTLQVNAAYERMYGWSKLETVEKSNMTDIIPSFLYAEAFELFEKIMAGGHETGYETKRLRKNGELFDVSITVSPIYNAKGEIIGAAYISRDISERKRTEEYFRKSEKLSVVGQLAAGVAHEIRNPLTSLKGFLQLLKRKSMDSRYFDVMLSELDRINEIVSEFLVIAKPQPLKFERRNLIGILKNIISLLESQAIINNVQIVRDWEDIEEFELECDENQLKQVFINILKNGVEAMPKGGQLILSVIRPDHGRVLIQFADQGQGIPEDRLPHLGEPFYTTKEKGTGLGLMVSFRIIEDHNGTVRVSSTVGKGTVFEISLPVE